MQSVTSNAVNKRLDIYKTNNLIPIVTDINVNAFDGGKTILVLMSSNAGADNGTLSIVGMIRCGYGNNNYSIIEIARSAGYPTSTTLQDLIFIDSNANIIVTPVSDTSNMEIEFICNK